MAKAVKLLDDNGLNYTEKAGKIIAEAYERLNLDFSAACDSLGISSKVARGWIAKYPTFAALIAETDSRATDKVKAALFQLAQDNPTAARLWLDVYGSRVDVAAGMDKEKSKVDGQAALKILKQLTEQEGGDSKPTTF